MGKATVRVLTINLEHGHGSVPPLAPGGRRSAARRGWSSDQNEEAGRHLRRAASPKSMELEYKTGQGTSRAERDEERRQKWATDPGPNRPDACHSLAGGPCPIFVSKHLSGRQRLLGTNMVLQLC